MHSSISIAYCYWLDLLQTRIGRPCVAGVARPRGRGRLSLNDSPGLQEEEQGQQGHQTPWETLTSLPRLDSLSGQWRPFHCFVSTIPVPSFA